MNDQKRLHHDSHYAIQDSHPLANVDHIKRKYLNIAYGNISASQKLDIYLPDKGTGPFPVIVSIHGGAFMGCDKADEQLLPMLEGLPRGYAVVSVNYRLSWEAIFPALVHDVKAAVRWIRANAHQYSFDPDKIVAWGGSAGGYLSLMLGVSSGISALEDLSIGDETQPDHVQVIVDWFGPTDFLKMDEQLAANGLRSPSGMEHNGSNSPESLLLGGTITDIPDRVHFANPETYIDERAAPALIQHGTRDPIVPVQQSIEIAAKLKQSIGEKNTVLELLEGAGHGGPQFGTPENINRVFDFLAEQLDAT